MSGLLGTILRVFLLVRYRTVWVTLLAIGLPLFIYLAFFAREPVFPVESDVELGRMSALQIAEDPEQFPVLPAEEYPEAYAHLERIVASVASSPEVRHGDLFAYDQVKIINDDGTLNAFCTPGGFVYVYTGLIKYLEAEDHLAGVLGHEIAHAELRHSSLRLQKAFGADALLKFIILGTPVGITDVVNAQIMAELMTLSYGRGQEAQSDEHSVRYLSTGPYACDGAAGFFAKIIAEGDDKRIPEILSSHPDPAARVREIRGAARELGCRTELGGDPSRWRALQAALPQEASPSEVEE